jgi:glutamyl-tRNA synthetase
MESINEITKKYAIKNAHEHKGEAQLGAVVGKVKALFPKEDVGKIMPSIKLIVNEINSMNKKEIEKNYIKYEKEGWELKKEEKEKTLPKLEWLEKGEKIITRVAPNPSGAMHFGHARPAILTDMYVKKYGGKFILRFDDTDPKIKKPIEGIEQEFLSEMMWLGIDIHQTANASDNLARYYEIIEKLIKDGNAYICDCDSEKWREKIWKSKPCPCRDKKPKEHLGKWKKMLKHEIKEGEAVVRLKTNLLAKDSSTRDWWLARVVDDVQHPNLKVKDKHVWPSYNLASAIDDHDMKINFIIRGQEHRQNEDKQKQLYDYFGWVYPHTKYHGKIGKVGDMILSKSKIKLLMEKGGLTRDDDPRLATLKSFRRRGFKPEAIRKVIFDLGLNINEAKISLENFAAANKQFLGEVFEYPFFEEAVEVEIINLPKGKVDMCGEEIELNGPIEKFLVDKKELSKQKNEIIRFKNAFNVKLTKISEYGGNAEFISYQNTNTTKCPIINWIIDPIDIEITMSDGSIKRGFSTPTIIEANGVIRIENIGYVNIEEKKNGIIKCVYGHK